MTHMHSRVDMFPALATIEMEDLVASEAYAFRSVARPPTQFPKLALLALPPGLGEDPSDEANTAPGSSQCQMWFL